MSVSTSDLQAAVARIEEKIERWSPLMAPQDSSQEVENLTRHLNDALAIIAQISDAADDVSRGIKTPAELVKLIDDARCAAGRLA